MEARGRKVGEISSLYFECEYCKALKFGSLPGMMYSSGESNWFNMCFHKGKICVELEQPTPLAQEIHDFWDDQSSFSVLELRTWRDT